jgi:UDP-N-acetylmuramoyl-tripeptide--D-alanyl-D-alanine ligase
VQWIALVAQPVLAEKNKNTLFKSQYKPRSICFGVFYFGPMIDTIFKHYLQVRKVTTDTRNIPAGAIFFALKGERFNGNTFAQQALDAGASMAVIDEERFKSDDRMVVVEDVLAALQEVALRYRQTFDIPVLGITGSNGKTTTKELVRDVLLKKFEVHATKGNLNNHIGVPLTLLSIASTTTLAIIEMGANHQKEIAGYCRYALPTHGLITNIGKAHLEGFGGEEGVFIGKRELFEAVKERGGVVFVNPELPRMSEAAAGAQRVEYGFHHGGMDLKVVSESPTLVYASTWEGATTEVTTHLAGAYNLYNIAASIAVGRHFGVLEADIHQAIGAYQPDNNRSQWHKTAYNDLILDAYNANPSSMEHALQAFARQNHADKTFVLGDMRELGEASQMEHERIFNLAQQLQLQGIWVGTWFREIAQNNGALGFTNVEEAMIHLKEQQWRDKLILVKGSRGIGLEQLVPVL